MKKDDSFTCPNQSEINIPAIIPIEQINMDLNDI